MRSSRCAGRVLGARRRFKALAITLLAITACAFSAKRLPLGRSPASLRLGQASKPLASHMERVPAVTGSSYAWIPGGAATIYSLLGMAAAGLLCAISINRLRVWNPSQQVRAQAPEIGIRPFGSTYPESLASAAILEGAAAPRHVWTNRSCGVRCVLGLHGRKLYVHCSPGHISCCFAAAMLGLYWSVESGVALQRSRLNDELIPTATKILAPFLVIT